MRWQYLYEARMVKWVNQLRWSCIPHHSAQLRAEIIFWLELLYVGLLWGHPQLFSQVMCLVGTCYTLHFWWALSFNVPCSYLIPPVSGFGKQLAHWISRVRSSRYVKHSAFVGTYPLFRIDHHANRSTLTAFRLARSSICSQSL